MTPLTNFHFLFEPHIITRGKGYLNNVVQLKNDFGNHWTALVKGTHRYKVEVELTQNGFGDVLIKQMHCNCEYWDNCKHQVAVLLKLQEKLKNGELKINNQEHIPALQQLLEQSDKQTLINFILHLNQNQPIENDFFLFINKNTKIKTSNTQINKIIQQKISDILTLDDENEWEEFVFDEQIDELTQLLSEFDHQPNNQMMVAITWIDTILAIYDDIFDEIAESIVLCLECLAKWLFNIENYWANWDNHFVDLAYQENESIIETLFVLLESWRQAIVRTNYAICPEIERFYFDLYWAYGNQTIAIHYLDDLIKIGEKYHNRDLDVLIAFKCQVWQFLKKDHQEILNHYQHLPKVRQVIIDNLLNNHKFDDAILMIKDGIKQTDNRMICQAWYEQLVEIGKKINDKILIKENSRILAFYRNEFNEEYLNLLKTHCTVQEWQKISNEISDELLTSQRYYLLAKFYEFNGNEIELVNGIKQSNDRELVDKFLKTIIKVDKEWVAEFYLAYWQKQIATLNNRDKYRSFANDIQKLMKQLPTAKPIWQAQVETWKAEFVKKRALVEELGRI